MKLSLTRIKKWKPVWIGVLAGLGLGVGSIIVRILINPNAPVPFYVRPYGWFFGSILRWATSPEQRSRHYDLLFIPEMLGYFIYFAVLGALLGFLFQSLLWMFRRLKRHDAAHQKHNN